MSHYQEMVEIQEAIFEEFVKNIRNDVVVVSALHRSESYMVAERYKLMAVINSLVLAKNTFQQELIEEKTSGDKLFSRLTNVPRVEVDDDS